MVDELFAQQLGPQSRRGSSGEPVQLAVVTRNGLIESRHFGSAVLIDPTGSVVTSIGETNAAFYARSAIKPLQAEGVLTLGVAVPDDCLAVACGSHGGTADHVNLVESILRGAGLTPSDLLCPEAMPSSATARDDAVRAGLPASRQFHNCSGKHALFLAACVINGWPIESYLDRGHPLHSAGMSSLESLTREQVMHVGVDGCGAPAPVLSLKALATGMRRIAVGEDSSQGLIAHAMVQNAWAVSGIGNQDTVIMEQLGFVAKVGAEGMMVVATPAGYAVALKIQDGSLRAAGAIALSLLSQADALDHHLSVGVTRLITGPVLGGGNRVGEVRACVQI